jgi:hypothetical protein
VGANWEFTPEAKRVRRVVYEGFLRSGKSVGTGELLLQTGLSPGALAAAIEELERGLMVMCPPGTHDVAKCPPWTNMPTRHAVEVGGKQVGYAGCALEAMNIAYCYPGEVVTIRTSCPETGTEIVIRLKGNEQVEITPASTVGHTGVDPARWGDNWFHGCAHNNFFASREAVAAWEAKHPEHRGVTLDMAQLKQFATYTYRLDYERGSDDYGPRDGFTMFGKLDVVIPEHWTRLDAQ